MSRRGVGGNSGWGNANNSNVNASPNPARTTTSNVGRTNNSSLTASSSNSNSNSSSNSSSNSTSNSNSSSNNFTPNRYGNNTRGGKSGSSSNSHGSTQRALFNNSTHHTANVDDNEKPSSSSNNYPDTWESYDSNHAHTNSSSTSSTSQSSHHLHPSHSSTASTQPNSSPGSSVQHTPFESPALTPSPPPGNNDDFKSDLLGSPVPFSSPPRTSSNADIPASPFSHHHHHGHHHHGHHHHHHHHSSLSASSSSSSSTTSSLCTIPQPREGEPAVHRVSFLYDPPVQGCELKPYIALAHFDGDITALPSDDTSLMLPLNFPVHFKWSRGERRVCSVSICGKNATLQCMVCLRMGGNKANSNASYFCSHKCMKENWNTHKHLHNSYANINPKSLDMPWNYDDESESSAASFNASNLFSPFHCFFPPPVVDTFTQVSDARSYTPAPDDVGRVLRLECVPQWKKAPEDANDKERKENSKVFLTSSACISAPSPPPPRPLSYVDPSHISNPGNQFKCLCYNVLAQIYATRHMYPYCPIWALNWDYRKHHLLREILQHQADIVCLQEVQASHFENFFLPNMQKAGYDGVYKKKTREGMNENPSMIDGCATFFRKDRFALIEQYGIEFNEAARQNMTNRNQLRRLLRGNIALVLVLEELSPPLHATARRMKKRRLCVTNTHIFWDPEYPDVKLWQTWVLCQELEKLVLPRNLPLVLCGDLNSLVESSVYELLSTEHVEAGDDVFGAVGDPTGLLPPPHQMTHRLPLTSAYGTLGEPKYTNYTGSFVGVLDYIFFTRTHLRCVSVLDVDEEQHLRKDTALPSPQYPSDHIALITTLEFLEN